MVSFLPNNQRSSSRTVNRACQGCNRKKVKCDMTRPVCRACARAGSKCVFLMRKRRRGKDSKKSPRSPRDLLPNWYTENEFNEHSNNQQPSSRELFNPVSLPNLPLLAHEEDVSSTLTDFVLSVEPGSSPLNTSDHSQIWNSDDNSVSNAKDINPLNLNGRYGLENDGWAYPVDTMGELTGLFFVYTQSWLPFMHQPTFNNKFIRKDSEVRSVVDRGTVSEDETFVIYSMCAIAARFSKSLAIENESSVHAGDILALHATTLKDALIRDLQNPTVDTIKGCTILAFYNLLAGDFGPGSILTSVCVRLAYQLSLDETDDDQMDENDSLVAGTIDEDPKSWLQKEELRRLWWSIWELDTFVSSLSLQPFSIARGQVKVLLPVPDFNWLCMIPMKSAFVDARPENIWKSLKGSPNQSPRAWFILTAYLKSVMLEEMRRPSRWSRSTVQIFNTALCSLKLSLPTTFHLGSLFLDRNNYEDGNWIISTHLMILVCELILTKSTLPYDDDVSTESQSVAENLSQFAERSTLYLSKISQVWSPEYSPLCNPIICCTLMIPAATVVQYPDYSHHGRDIARILLGHYAKYWELGSEMLRLLDIIEQRQTQGTEHTQLTDHELILKRFSAFVPSMSRPKRLRITGSAQY